MTNNNWIETIKLNVQYDEAELGCNWSLDELINFISNLLTKKDQEHKAELESIKGELGDFMEEYLISQKDMAHILDSHINKQ